MNKQCENFAVALSSESPFRRWQARRHAARCRRCARIHVDLQHIARALGEVSPLTSTQRQLWAAVASDAPPLAARRFAWSPPAALGLIAALVLVGVVMVWAMSRVNHPKDPPKTADLSASEATDLIPPEMSVLRERVVALTQELDLLREQAELLDARKNVDALIVQLAPADPSQSGGSGGL